MLGLRFEGLRETLQALRLVNTGLYQAILDGLAAGGRIIRDDAAQRFVAWGNAGDSAASAAGFQKGAEGFRVLVRPNTSSMPIVAVAETIRRSGDMQLRRSNFGDLIMRHGLIPARSAKLADVAVAIDESVTTLLRTNGF